MSVGVCVCVFKTITTTKTNENKKATTTANIASNEEYSYLNCAIYKAQLVSLKLSQQAPFRGTFAGI